MPSLIGGITLGPDGNLWYTFVAGTVGNINANTGVVTTFNGVTSTEENCTMGLPNTDRPSAGPVHLGIILTGPDGQLWFGAQCGIPLTAGLSGFNQITTSGALSGNLSEYYNAPEIVDATVTPSGVWATMLGLGNDDGVAVFDPTSALPAQFNCTSPPPFLGSIMGGPDGAVWATANDPTTQPQQHLFVRLSPSCQLTVVATQTSSTYSGVASAAGSVWTLKTPNSIAKFSMSGTETDFVISNPLGPDGGSIQASSFEPQYIYFDDADNGRVGRMNVGTGKVEEFAIPNGGTVFHPMDMAIDASGNIWTHDLQTILKITFPN